MPLNVGSIAIVGFNADGNDNLAFVSLTDIPAGETIYFEDNEWNGTGFADTNESAFSWTSTTSIAAGTIVQIDNIGTGTISTNTGTVTTPVTGRGSNRGLAAGDEVLYAYQGAPGAPTTFITAVANGGFNTTTNGLLTGTGLTAGTTALDLSTVDDDADVGAYNGARSGQTSFSAYLTLINNPANWQTQDGTGDQSIDGVSPDVPFSANAFTLGAGGGGNPTVNLSVSATTASEAGQTVITVTATASSAVTGDQTVNVGATGTGITVGDYTFSAGTITIPNGATTGSVTFTVVDDAIAEGTETALLTISNPSAGVTLGGTTSQSIAIADNDAAQSGVLQKVGGFTSANGAEIPAFDPGSDRLFTVAGSTIEILSVSNTGALTLAGSLTPGFTPPAGTNVVPNSVAVKNGIVAVAYAVVDATTKAQQTGRVSFYNAADGTFLNSVAVGFLPDMLTFTPDGTKVLVANEGEPNSYNQATSFDPEGSVSVIDLAGGVANATVQNASFTSFNSQINALKAAGVRITGPGSTVAQDLEPEYIAVASDGLTAQVTLQENNAIAILDIASATITQIIPLGVKDHSQPGNGLDASDRDGGINIRTQPVFGLYQPDAIASFTANGQTYYITANEGDARDYTGFAEEVRVGAATATLDPTLFPNAATLKDNANLGRLTVSRTTSDKDGDGDLDRIEAFGARSFSILDANGTLVFDSGDQLEQITATQAPTLFNSDGTAAGFDSRSDNKGPEPEGVTIGVINNRTYAFIGLERVGDVIVYEVTNPNKPVFVQYINTPEDVGTEGLTFISAADSPTGKPLLATANEVSKTVALFEVKPPVRISDIQGASHTSPLNGQTVTGVSGVVTVLRSNGFYLQDPNPDSSDATSEGIFVFTSSVPTVQVGDAIQVSGTVSEFRAGGATSANLSTTQISNPNITVLSSGNALPTATILGNGGRTIPTSVINDDGTGNVETSGTFDPATDGIDFYESLEGMLVQVNNPVATSPTATFGTSQEIWVLADNGANATSRTARGGSLINASDFNPERIQIDDLNNALVLPEVNVGAQLSTIVGVVNYDFGNFEVLVSTAPTVVQASSLHKEVTNLTATANQLTIANFNVENLDPVVEDINKVQGRNPNNVDDDLGTGKFDALAQAIVNNLKTPDIISLEEIQDNTGAEIGDGVVASDVTLNLLIDRIVAAGGPRYEFQVLNPVEGQDGGQPGGNIRVGFLFNPNRVSFVEGSLQRLTDTNPAESDSFPGDDFASSRKPLVGTFLFNGQEVTIVANHFNSKGGDQPLFGRFQPPTLTSEAQRLQQAAIVRDFVQSVLAVNPNANVVVAGDLNDFEFSNPINLVESAGLTNLIETLPANERYTYNFQGNAQTLDHILVSGNLFKQLDGFDVVHINSEFADQISDHDPSVARFSFNSAPTALALTATNVDENVAVNTTIGTFTTSDFDPGNTFTYSLVSGAGSTDNSAFSINNNQLQINLSPDFETQSSYTIRVRTTDQGGLSLENALTIAVNNLNEAPVNTVPGSQTTKQGNTLVFSAANGNAIVINDVDANNGLEQVKLSVTNGALKLSSTIGLTLVDGSDNSASLTVKGTLGDLNTALSGLQFTPDAPSVINGSVTLTILTDDLGNTGAGGAKTDTDTVAIAVNPANLIRGNGGNNTLFGTLRSDTIYGGGGNDTIFGLRGSDILLGEAGNDQLFGGLGNDYLDGGSGNDRITDLGGNNTIFGGAGNDTIFAGFGANLIDGGSGNDAIYLFFGQDTIALARGNGSDTIYNYNAGSTRFNLTAGLLYNDLTIVQDGSSTSILAGSEKLASLAGVRATSVTSSSFITA